jgi:hypothetical protein
MPKRKGMKGKGVMDVLRYIKDNKLISGGLGLIPSPYTQAGAAVARLVGLGKRRKAPKKKRAMKGRGIFSDIGGGLGSVFGGLGGGIGSIAHGLFGGGKVRRRAILI